MRFLILAAGVGYRWRDYMGIRKHELVIDGERIIDRTVRQLDGHEVVIVGPDDDRYRIPGAELYTPPQLEPTGVQIDKFLSSQEVWNEDGPTAFLWGDVRWTDEAIQKVIDYDAGEWQVFYRPGRSHLTGTGNGEMFAHVFYPHERDAELAACERIVDLHRREIVPWSNTGGWGHYRAMLGLPDEEVHGWHDGRHATLIDDWTDDFDGPHDFRAWYGRWVAGRYRVAAEPWSWEFPAQSDPEAIVHVNGPGRIPSDSLWCAVALAVEKGETVIPYSHLCETSRWDVEPMHTATKDRRILVAPAGKKPAWKGTVRLSGPLYV